MIRLFFDDFVYSIQPMNENRSPTKPSKSLVNKAFRLCVKSYIVQPIVQPIVHTSPKTAKKKADRKKDRKRQRKKQRNRERIERKIIKKKYI